MAKKKVVKKKAVKKKVVRITRAKKAPSTTKRSFFVWKKFLVFLVLAIVSYLIASVAGEGLAARIFVLLFLVFGFIALALLIVLFAIWIIRKLR